MLAQINHQAQWCSALTQTQESAEPRRILLGRFQPKNLLDDPNIIPLDSPTRVEKPRVVRILCSISYYDKMKNHDKRKECRIETMGLCSWLKAQRPASSPACCPDSAAPTPWQRDRVGTSRSGDLSAAINSSQQGPVAANISQKYRSDFGDLIYAPAQWFAQKCRQCVGRRRRQHLSMC